MIKPCRVVLILPASEATSVDEFFVDRCGKTNCMMTFSIMTNSLDSSSVLRDVTLLELVMKSTYKSYIYNYTSTLAK